MFTGVGKLKISLAECGFGLEEEVYDQVSVGVCVGERSVGFHTYFYDQNILHLHLGLSRAAHTVSYAWAAEAHTLWLHQKVGDISHCVPACFCVLFADNWPLMVHLLQS